MEFLFPLPPPSPARVAGLPFTRAKRRGETEGVGEAAGEHKGDEKKKKGSPRCTKSEAQKETNAHAQAPTRRKYSTCVAVERDTETHTHREREEKGSETRRGVREKAKSAIREPQNAEGVTQKRKTTLSAPSPKRERDAHPEKMWELQKPQSLAATGAPASFSNREREQEAKKQRQETRARGTRHVCLSGDSEERKKKKVLVPLFFLLNAWVSSSLARPLSFTPVALCCIALPPVTATRYKTRFLPNN